MAMSSTVGLVLLVTVLAVNVKVSIGQVSAICYYYSIMFSRVSRTIGNKHECAVYVVERIFFF